MMKTSLKHIALIALSVTFFPVAALAAKSASDILPPLKRQVSVKLAQGFVNRPELKPVSADLPSPFNPADFEKPDPADAQASAAAGARPASGGPSTAAPGAGPAKPAQQVGDRAILEAVVGRIPALGMIIRDGKPLLMLGGGKRAEIGSTFTVSYDNQDYELEVVAIDRTTFTLRYRGEEITRSIRLTK